MREFLIDEDNTDPVIGKFIKSLQSKVENEIGNTNLDNLCRDELLNKALQCNPERIKDIKIRQEKVQRMHQNKAR